MYGFNHSAWGNGRAGKLVEFTPIAFDFPAFLGRLLQGFVVKTQYPVAAIRFDGITQAGCFTV